MNPVQRSDLQLGELLAEGGEGRVFEVRSGPADLGPNRVYKELRRPSPLPELSSLVAFPSMLAARDGSLSARVVSSSAWPVSIVVGSDPALALGTVLPRAPNEFWVRHRDGTNRLASLSYLANDPDRIAVAYGVMMPAPGAPERVALVYALARLLDAWQGGDGGLLQPQVVHGDLSAKNVLWSLRPAPAVYVLDCDGATVTAEEEAAPGAATEPGEVIDDGHHGGETANGSRPESNGDAPDHPALSAALPASQPKRSRATTPNWGDPAKPPGGAPTAASDRYLLAITFLRVVGAAHFPIQGHQRAGQKVNVDLELPRTWRKLPDMPGLWELCERSLSLVNAADRPRPRDWVVQLEELLGVISAAGLADSVRRAQGDPRPAPAVPKGARPALQTQSVTVPDVVVRPVLRHRAPSTWRLISAGAPLGVGGEVMSGWAGASGTPRGGAISSLGGAGRPGAAPAPLTPRQMAASVMVTWGAAHRAAARWVRSPGRRAYGVRRLAGVLVLDLAAACVAVFVVAMIISPWIGL
jgi:hypothetical protein